MVALISRTWLGISRRIVSLRPPIHLLAPSILVVAAMMLPLVYLAIRASGTGLEDWARLLHPRVLQVIWQSVWLAVSVVVASNLIAIPLAWFTVRTNLPGRRFWMIATTLPLVIPSYVGAYAMIGSFGPNGFVYQILSESLHVREMPSIYGFYGAAIALTLFSYPYVLINVRTALAGLDPSMEDAGRSLGDKSLRIFFKIVLPQLRPSIAAGSLLVALYVLSDFGAVSLFRYTTFTRAIYTQYSASFDRSFAAVLSLVLVVITASVLAVESQMRGRARMYSRSNRLRPFVLIELGYWKWGAFLLCVFVTVAAVGIPIGVIFYWLLRGSTDGLTFAEIALPALRSVIASAAAAIAVLLGALPVALMIVRYPSGFARTVEQISYLGYALPGIVTALALVFVGATYLPFIYQSLAMLIFAYVTRFLPEAIGAIRVSLLQISPGLEDAARGLGAGATRVLFSLTVPLLRSGILSSIILVFLTAMKELPATLLLAPIGYDTLAVKVWSATQEGFFARAAIPALMLVAVSGLSASYVLGKDAIKNVEST